jgi:hypothetical protein
MFSQKFGNFCFLKIIFETVHVLCNSWVWVTDKNKIQELVGFGYFILGFFT